jgi:hypothetical protein
LVQNVASCHNGVHHRSPSVKLYLKTFLIVGASLGALTHFVTRYPMPWWPDTAIMGSAFGTVATLSVFQHRRTNRIMWNRIKASFRRS